MGAEIDWLGLYWLVLFQVLAGVVLLRAKQPQPFLLRILGALFLLNAAVSAIMLLPRGDGIWLHSDPGALTRTFRALDAPTGPLLLALVFGLGERRWQRATAWGLIAVAAVAAVAEFPFHRFLAWNDHYVRGVPYYIGLSAAVWRFAGGTTWQRWVALALLPRALYWGTAGTIDVFEAGLGAAPELYVNRVGLLVLAIVAVASAARLVMGPAEPNHGTVIAILAVGPLAATLEAAVAASLPPDAFFRYGTVVVLNLLTLGLVRPALTLLGVAPWTLVPVLVRATAASAAGLVGAFILSPLGEAGAAGGIGVALDFGMGLGVALIVMAIFEGARPMRAQPPTPDAPVMPVPQRGTAPDLLDTGRPQWQRILLALQGSAVADGAATGGEPHLTQKAIVARTGIAAPRVSMLTRQLNESAQGRLDTYVPGWTEDAARGSTPELVRQYEGTIPGAAGVWVYYRLTPLGEALAAAIAAQHQPPGTATVARKRTGDAIT